MNIKLTRLISTSSRGRNEEGGHEASEGVHRADSAGRRYSPKMASGAESPTPTSQRKSIFRAFRTKQKDKTGHGKRLTAEDVVNAQGRQRQADRLDEDKMSTLELRDQLLERERKLERSNERKMAELEKLQAHEAARKGEDELFQMRAMELHNANKVITTRDTVPGEVVRKELKDLNDQIRQLASNAARGRYVFGINL